MINISSLKNKTVANSHVFTDLDLNFQQKQVSGNNRNKDVASGKDLVVLTDINAVKNSINNILFQNRYTSNLKTNLKSYIGDFVTELKAESLGEEIQKVIINYEPRVNLKKIYVHPNIEENLYNIGIVLSMPDFEMPEVSLIANLDNNGAFEFVNS